jgi:adhesin HecA-like repeat protein
MPSLIRTIGHKIIHLLVLLSYVFHGCAPAFATRTSFEMGEERQKKVSSLDVLHSVMRKRAQNEALWHENKQAPVRQEPRSYDASHLGFRTQVKSFEEGYTLKVQSLSSQMNGSVWPGVQLTLTQKNGDEVRTLENRTFSSKTFNASTFDSMTFDEEEQQNVLPFKDWKNRSLGFSYDLKGVGRIYVCWEGSLLLHNLHFRDVALNIQTTGAILANNLDGSTLNLEGRAIAFGGENNKISTLSMSFGEGLESEREGLEGLGSRIAHVMPGTILVTHDLSVQGGILQNSGRLSALSSFKGIDTHVINDDHITAEALTLKGGTLKNQGTLKAPVTAEGLDLIDNSGVIEGPWSVSSNSFINTGSITGTGQLKADVLENYGLLGDTNSVFNIKKTASNHGYLKAGKVTGNSTFTNHHQLETEVLDVPVFLNQQRENVPFKPSVAGDSLTITKRVRQFTNDKGSTIAVKRLVMEKREESARKVKNDGVIEGDQITLQGSVENKGSIRTQNFAWQGDTFKTEELQADHIQLEGERLQNLGSFEALSGSLLLHHLENQGDMTLTLTTRSKVASLMNKGGLTLNGTSRIRTLINEKKAKLVLKDGTLITRQLHNHGAVTLDGFVTVLRDGRLQFGKPSVLFGTWQVPEIIQGDLGLGVHLSSLKFDRLKKMPEAALHVYGKSFSNTSDRVFLHPLHILVEDFKNTSRLRAPELSVNAKTIENDGSITGSTLTLHATQVGQNSGRLEATERLDVDLPQIDSLGTLISKGDLVFKTANRSITLCDTHSWLHVGRNLYMTLLNGDLHVKDHHKFPGNVNFESDRFTLKGSVETFGNLGVQARGDINIEGEQLEVVEPLTLMDLYKEAQRDPESYQKLLQELSPSDKSQIFQYSLQTMGSDDMRRHRPMNFDQLLWFFDRSRILGVIGQYIHRLYPPYFSDGTQKPSSHIFNLSNLKSHGHLSLSAQNVNNTGGQVQGEQSLTIQALQNILNGSSYETKRRESTIYSSEGSLWHYPIPEVKGNGSFFSTSGPLTLQAGSNITNTHGWMFGGTGLRSRSGHDTINLAGHILSGGKTHLSGKSFLNSREGVVRVKTGPDNNDNPHGRWFINDEILPKHSGRINHPLQDYPTSGPALVQSLDDITFDFSHAISNRASSILASGRIDENKALISNLSVNLIAQASLHADNSWTKEPVRVNAGFLPAISSSSVALSLENFQGLVNTGILSAPRIQMKGARFVTFVDPDASNTSLLATRKQIIRSGSLQPMLQALQSLPFGWESDQRFNPRSQVIIGSLGRTIPPVFGGTTQTLFALQQFFAENFHKSYILPYLKPLEQFIKFQSNARKIALKHRGQRSLPWKPLVVSEEEATKTTLPMILYRPTLVEDVERLVPEYWGPKDLIHRLLMEPCPALFADTRADIEEIDDLDMRGSNMAAGEEINVDVNKLTDGALVGLQNTPYGHEGVPVGGNKEVGKPGKPGKIRLKGRERFDINGGSAETHGGTYTAQSNCPMNIGVAVTHHLYEGEGTRREETRNHPFQLNTGDGSFITPDTLTLEATQAKATRTLWAEGSNILMPSRVDTYHQEQNTTQKDLFGSSTTKETTHRETHQVLNFAAGTSITTKATSRDIDAIAPIMTAPKIVFDFQNGGLLLRAFANKFFYNREELDKNAFFITSGVSGSSSTTYGGPQIEAEEIITSDDRPMAAEVHENQLKDPNTFIRHLQQKGATIDTLHDEYKSWEETKMSVGPGLAALIAIGASIIMPGIGSGTIGYALTHTAAQVSSRATISLINNQGDFLKAFEDLKSPDFLREILLPSPKSFLTAQLGGLLGIPLHPIGTDIIAHAQSALLNATSRIAADSITSGEDFSDVLKGAFRELSASFVSSYGSANIGSWHHSNVINTLEQNLAHAAVGALSGELLKGDPLSGAIGAVVGENVGKKLREEMEEAGITQDHPDYDLSLDRAINIAKFTAVAAASALNKDPDAASLAAANAARHNSFSYHPDLPSMDQVVTDTRRFVEDIHEGIESFADAGEDIAAAVSDAVGLGGICKEVLASMSHDAGLVVGVGVNAIGMWRGKGTKAPRGPRPKRTREARGAPSVETRSASNKRGTRTEPEAIEPTITPTRKSARLANKASPGGKNSNNVNLGLERPQQSPYYTSIFNAQLEKQKHYPGKLDKVHFQEANKQLYNSMQSDLSLKASLNRLYPGLEKAIAPNAKGVFPSKPPTSIGLTWHHDAYNAGRMDLILRSHHTSAGPVQHNLHPNQKGGMELWGGGRKNKDK